MKSLKQLSLLSSLVLSTSVFALNPVQGPYLGLIATGSHGPNIDFNFPYLGVNYPGQLKYNPLGGGAGLALGYKIQNFRLEAEGLFNYIGYDKITVGDCSIVTPNIITPIGICPAIFTDAGLGVRGHTTAGFGMFNAYFDFLTSENETGVVPFVGLGIGYAQLRSYTQYTNKTAMTTLEINEKSTGSAAQGILGVSYFMDDYVWGSFDARYLSTKSMEAFGDSRYSLITLNISVDLAFDKG